VAAMRALWTEDQATFCGDDVSFTGSVLRPQPLQGSIPVLIGGHSEVAARRAGRIGDGFFPFGVPGDEMEHLLRVMRDTAEESGRDPSSVEVTVSTHHLDPARAAEEIDALAAMGVERVVVPAALFRDDLVGGLGRYGDDVIAVGR